MKYFKHINSFEKVVFIISIIGVLITFLISFQAWLINDDFLFITNLRKLGVSNFLFEMYLNWDGRQLTPAGFFQSVFELYLYPYLSVPIYLTAFYFSVFNLLKMLFRLAFKEIFVLTFLFTFSMFPFLKHIVFWQNGGIYSLFLLQGVLLLIIFERKPIDNLLCLFIIGLILSLTTQNLFIPIFLFVLIKVLHDFYFHNKFNSKDLIILVSMIVGIGIVSFAPGNFSRIIAQTEVNSVLDSIKFIPSLYLSVIGYAKYPLIIGFISFFYFGSNLSGMHSNYSINKFIFLFFFLSFSSILIFSRYPHLAFPRSLFMASFLCFPLGAFCGSRLSKYLHIIMRRSSIVLLLGVSLMFFIHQFYYIYKCSESIETRHNFLLSKSGSSETVNYELIKCSNILIFIVPSQQPIWQPYLKSYYNIENLRFED
ncbi:DUF6056 family protein [uncultured Algoriphagus sp.]|uniref:DUF6056 family protein n=1 Tax=uncultured Algoriphagus sp. TaxID=417365 RepID=UPI0030EB4FAC